MFDRQRLIASCALGALAWASAAAAQQSSDATSQGATGVNRTDQGQRAAPKTQDTGAGSTKTVSEVVVTSANRTSKIQQAPVAITAFTDERRNLLGIENARDITNNTPSMSLQGEYLTLRGVGRYEDPGQGIDPGIAVYVDGVYTSSPAYLNQPDFLADRIEVLRGPQSVFGRNSLGGSVSVYSRRPSDVLSGDLRSGFTSQGYAYVDAAVSGPITSTLKYRLGYTWSDLFSGLQENLSPFGSRKGLGTGAGKLYEAQLQWDPTSDFTVWGRFQQYSGSLVGDYGVGGGYGQGGVGLAGPYNSASTAGFYGLAPNPQFGLPPYSNPSIGDKFRTATTYPGNIATHDDYTGTINASYDFHWAKLNYIAGYSQYTYLSLTDASQSGRLFMTSPIGTTLPSEYLYDVDQRKKWFSNEVNLTSPNDQRLRWVVGGFQYSERYKTFFGVDDPEAAYFASPYLTPPSLTSPGVLAAPNPRRSFYAQTTTLRTDSQAVYGQVDFDITRQFKATVSARYNWDQRYGGDRFRYVYDLYGFFGDFGEGMSALDVTPTGPDNSPTGSGGEAHLNFSDWTGKVGLEYHPDSSLTAYLSAAKGYQAGGFDLGGFGLIPSVKQEELYDYEGGIKKQFGSVLTVDLSSYYYDYNNLQIPVTEAVGGTNPYTKAPVTVPTTVLTNAQRSRSYGVELESIFSPRENLHFTLIYSYINAKFLNFTLPAGLIQDPASPTGRTYGNLRGFNIPQTPHNKVSFIPNYVLHTPSADLSLSATLSYVDSQYYRVYNTPADQGPSYYNLDLRAVLQPKTNTHLTLIAYARNVTNQRQVIYYAPTGAYPTTTPTVGVTLANPLYTVAEPFSFGMEAQYRF